MKESEIIGRVKLDLSHYPGEDFYSDGDVELELLEVVKDTPAEEFDRVIRERLSWPVLYHLTKERENILRWIPFDGTEKVLEVGAGPGAMTGALTERCAQVHCIDLSRTRSLINAYRHKDAENLTLYVGNFADVEPDLAENYYDYIFLIGVLEYGASYLDVEDPFGEEIRRLKRHLAPGGRLVIAIENRLGLKYFAGCREDHTSRYFDGIEAYPDPANRIRTFSRPALEALLARCGLAEQHFYYPYPDYKLMHTLFSDARLPKGTELTDNVRNFDWDRLMLFREEAAYRGITEDGLYPIFANSFLVVAGPDLPVKYARFADARQDKYRLVTTQVRQGEQNYIVKRAACPAARDHVLGMLTAAEALAARYESIHVCPAAKTGEDAVRFDHVKGRGLDEILDEAMAAGDTDGAVRLLNEYAKRVGENAPRGGGDADMVFSNLMAEGSLAEALTGPWTAIDYEWYTETPPDPRELLTRALTVYRAGDEIRERFVKRLLPSLSLTEEDLMRAAEAESAFQREIAGEVLPLGALRDRIGGAVIRPEVLDMRGHDRPSRDSRGFCVYRPDRPEKLDSVQIYWDTGKGYSEADSAFLEETYGAEGRIGIRVELPEGAVGFRVDPALCPCFFLPISIRVDGQELRRPEKVSTTDGRRTDGGILFTTQDPWISFDLRRIAGAGAKVFEMEWQIAPLPGTMAKRLGEVKKRWL